MTETPSMLDVPVADADPWVDGAALLDDIRSTLRAYCVLPSEHAYSAVALWVAYTHCVSAFDYAPRLVVRSSLKRSGKTRLLEIVGGLSSRTLRTSSVSVAYLFRIIGEDDPPTVLIDEADAIFGTRVKADQNEDLRSLLNAGYQRGSTVGRVSGRGHQPENFQTFAPVALAGIGRMPDTIEDRAVVIQMRRRKASEEVAPFRMRRDGPVLAALRARLEQWSVQVAKHLENSEPDLPVEDRAADTWEPLVAVADSAGRDWGRVARAAAIQFTYDAEVDEGQSRELMLLSDVRRIFDELDAPFVATVDMLEYLSIADDAPWSDLTAKALGQRMSTFGIRASHSFDRKQRGYRKNDFADAFERYLPDREA